MSETYTQCPRCESFYDPNLATCPYCKTVPSTPKPDYEVQVVTLSPQSLRELQSLTSVSTYPVNGWQEMRRGCFLAFGFAIAPIVAFGIMFFLLGGLSGIASLFS